MFTFNILLPGETMAQGVSLASDAVTPSSLFVTILDWALIIIVILGVVLMPIAGYSWFKRNRENHIWIDFFKSASFWIRIILIIIAFILWYFKIIDRIVNLILN